MSAKALGIAGSPRRRGNSTTLLRAVLEGAAGKGAETALIRLNDLTFRGCQGCERCAPGGECIGRDALLPVLQAMKLADVIVLASPIYFDGVTGQMKLFFDRCRSLMYDDGERKDRLTGKRRAAVIVTYEDKEREDYTREAKVLAGYLSWTGDFGEVEVMAEARLGPADAAGGRPELIEKAKALGARLVREKLGSRSAHFCPRCQRRPR